MLPCIYVLQMYAVPKEARRGHLPDQIPGTEVTEYLEAPVCLLGIKLVPFRREASALNL